MFATHLAHEHEHVDRWAVAAVLDGHTFINAAVYSEPLLSAGAKHWNRHAHGAAFGIFDRVKYRAAFIATAAAGSTNAAHSTAGDCFGLCAPDEWKRDTGRLEGVA